MKAPNYEELYDFETHLEKAFLKVFKPHMDARGIQLTTFHSAEPGVLPRLAILVTVSGETGPQGIVAQYATNTPNPNLAAAYTFEVQFQHHYKGAQDRNLRGIIRDIMRPNNDVTAQPDYLDIIDLTHEATGRELDNDERSYIYVITYAGTFAIKPDAWPDDIP